MASNSDAARPEVLVSDGGCTAGLGVDLALASELQAALLKFDAQQHAGVKYVGESQHITGFELPNQEAFEAIWEGARDEPERFRPW